MQKVAVLVVNLQEVKIMYKITNIYHVKRGFETDGKQFVLKPKESIIIKKVPYGVPDGIFKIEEAQNRPSVEEKLQVKTKTEEDKK